LLALFHSCRKFIHDFAAGRISLAPGFSQVIRDLTFIKTVLTVSSGDAEPIGALALISLTPFHDVRGFVNESGAYLFLCAPALGWKIHGCPLTTKPLKRFTGLWSLPVTGLKPGANETGLPMGRPHSCKVTTRSTLAYQASCFLSY
jgi:hypothetical protein